jgi:tetratricopeptide (TPR) repeat protein
MTTTAENRIFLIVRSLEVDARSLVEKFLEPTIGLSKLLTPFKDKIRNRANADELLASPLEFLDFGDIFEIFNANRSEFPSEVTADLETIRASTSRIVRIRNAVMHGRSLTQDDEESLNLIVRGLRSKLWQNLHLTINSMETGEINLSFEAQPDNSNVLHNLPRPDHNDTSLIGRRKEVSEIIDLILQSRSSVITITGPGGVGKTALALEIAYGFVEKEAPFELILWASFKNEKLTVDGIQEITSATKSFPEMSQYFSDFIGSSIENSYKSLGGALKGINTLLCLDNLETVTGEEFIEFYNAMPDSCKFLITSRRGIGQIERRFDLNPISKRDAIHFIHQLIRNHRVSELQKANSESIEAIVERYGNNPLAIKWFVQSVGAGIPIMEILKYREKEFFEFCVGNVVARLTDNARNVLFALQHLNRFVSIEELLLLVGLEEQDLTDSVRELMVNSLLQSRIVGQEIRQQVQLTESASKYVKNIELRDETFFANLKKEELRIREDETARQRDLESPYSPYAISTRDNEDLPIVTLLRKAIRESRNNKSKSIELVSTARKLAADFWEVDKTEAIIRFWIGDMHLVGSLYLSAIEKAPDSERKSIVYFLYAGFLARQGQGKEALEVLDAIPNELIDENVLALRGDCRLRMGQIESGLTDLKKSLESSNLKTVIVNKTRLMKGYERIAELVFDREKNFSKAFDYLDMGYALFSEMFEAKIRDFKLWDNYCGLLFMGLRVLDKSIKMNKSQYLESLDRFERLLGYATFVLTDNKFGFSLSAAFRRQASSSAEFRQRIESIGLEISSEGAVDIPQSSEVHVGEIINWLEEKRYGFISSSTFPTNVYFNEWCLFPGQIIDELKKGTRVSFEINMGFTPRAGGAPKAQFVKTLEQNP